MPELIRESYQLRNEAPLNFVSLRSLVDGIGSGVLSRVEMNALQAPLTAPPNREDKCAFDEADDFIDSRERPRRHYVLSAPARCASTPGRLKSASDESPMRATGPASVAAACVLPSGSGAEVFCQFASGQVM